MVLIFDISASTGTPIPSVSIPPPPGAEGSFSGTGIGTTLASSTASVGSAILGTSNPTTSLASSILGGPTPSGLRNGDGPADSGAPNAASGVWDQSREVMIAGLVGSLGLLYI